MLYVGLHEPRRVGRRLWPRKQEGRDVIAIEGHLLFRFNNVAFSPLAEEGSELLRAVDELLRLERWEQAHKQAICHKLYEAFARASDKEASRPLLNLKRDIFGDRDTKVSAEVALALCPDDALAEWYRGRARRAELITRLTPLYEQGLTQERQRLRQLLGQPRFMQACIVSSASMYDAVRSYTGTPVEKHDGRRRKMEYSLLQYLTRAVYRTSPYSFYTSVALGLWDGPDASSLPLRVGSTRAVQVEANHAVTRRLLDALVKRPELASHLEYRLSDGLRVVDGRLAFDISVDDPVNQPRVYGTTQKRGSLPLTATLVALRKWLESSPGGCRPHAAIVEALSAAVKGASREQVRAYVDSLITAGLLRPSVPLPEQTTPIAAEAGAFLRKLPQELAQRAADLLGAVTGIHDGFSGMDAAARSGAMRALEGHWKNAFELVGAQAPANTPLLYEDTALPGVLRLDSAPWSKPVEDLRALVDVLGSLYDPSHVLKALVCDEFVRRYGAGGVCTDIDSFIELAPQLYTRWFEIALRALPQELASRHPHLATLRTVRARLTEHLLSRLSEPEEISIDPAFLRELAAAIPPELTADWSAYSAFVQPEVVGGRVERLVVNHLYNGLGQYASRFLPLLGEEALGVVRQCIDRFFPQEHIVAGVRPVVGFNANLHPRMARTDVALDAHAPPEALRLSELVLAHDTALNQVVLRKAGTGQPVTMLYSGFLITYLLPPKLSFLASLGGNGPLTFGFHNAADARLGPEGRRQLRHFPRVTYGGVVLFRRRWHVPAALMPRQGPAETEAAYFTRLNQWRLSQGLPEECFLRSRAAEAEQGVKPEEWAQQLAKTREKAQYLDFRSCLLVRLLAKWLRDNEQADLVLEEVLPAVSRSVVETSEGRHATEAVIELSRRRGDWQST